MQSNGTPIPIGNNLDNLGTGQTVIVTPSQPDRPLKEVPYVNSGNKKLFEKLQSTSVKETPVSDAPEGERPEESLDSATKKVILNLRESVKSASLFLYKNGQPSNDFLGSQIVLQVEIATQTGSKYQVFNTTSSQLKQVKGYVTDQPNDFISLDNKASSNFLADIECIDEGVCELIFVTLTAKSNEKYTITFAVTKKTVDVIVRKQNNQTKPTHIESIVNNNPKATKVDIAVADGVTNTRLRIGDEIELLVPVTDSRKTDALVPNENVKVKGAKVNKVIYQGVSPDTGESGTGSVIVDVHSQTDGETKESVDRLMFVNKEDKQLVDSQMDDSDIEDQIEDSIASGKTKQQWEQVGVNTDTSLFYHDIKDEQLLARVLKQEAQLEKLRNHPKVVAAINFVDESRGLNTLRTVCNKFIKNVAPVRKHIARALLKSEVSPNFATIMFKESPYGRVDGYKMIVNDNRDKDNTYCESAAGIYQINFATYEDLINGTHSRGSYVEKLTESGHEWIHTRSKLNTEEYFEGSNRKMRWTQGRTGAGCNVNNPEVFKADHRMFVESSSILIGAQFRFIYNKYNKAPISYGSFNLGPSRFHNQDRFKGLSLVEIDTFNMDRYNIDKKKQSVYKSGLKYSFDSIAIRTILTQPENYCGDYDLDQNKIMEIYAQADEDIKAPAFQKETKLFSPDGPLMPEHKK